MPHGHSLSSSSTALLDKIYSSALTKGQEMVSLLVAREEACREASDLRGRSCKCQDKRKKRSMAVELDALRSELEDMRAAEAGHAEKLKHYAAAIHDGHAQVTADATRLAACRADLAAVRQEAAWHAAGRELAAMALEDCLSNARWQEAAHGGATGVLRDTELEALREEVEACTRERRALEDDVKILESRLTSSSEEIDEAQAARLEVESHVAQMQGRSAMALEDILSDAVTKLAQRDDKICELSTLLEYSQKELRAAREDLGLMKKDVEALVAEVAVSEDRAFRIEQSALQAAADAEDRCARQKLEHERQLVKLTVAMEEALVEDAQQVIQAMSQQIRACERRWQEGLMETQMSYLSQLAKLPARIFKPMAGVEDRLSKQVTKAQSVIADVVRELGLVLDGLIRSQGACADQSAVLEARAAEIRRLQGVVDALSDRFDCLRDFCNVDGQIAKVDQAVARLGDVRSSEASASAAEEEARRRRNRLLALTPGAKEVRFSLRSRTMPAG
mmetsp:Transcript_88865/g.237865  ORF Transcript_88865/g.237865 Transcript_88865/m.237865 type:complete len:507 (-) Transcript_88865:164-1684(-)